MHIIDLITILSQPSAYPHATGPIEVHQTHISAVFLAGPFAYKIKKPIDLGFLDFTSLQKRRFYCDEEVRLNRRSAPNVYLGVVPITRDGMEAGGAVVEWAVQMQRLPSDATLETHVERGTVTPEQITTLAERVARFHQSAETNTRISSFGRFDVVAANARENFVQTEAHIGAAVSAEVHGRLRERTEAVLGELRDLIESRAARNVPRDTHGDLHLDHVYLFPDRAPPNDMALIDCIEFADRFRFADPVPDMAFLVMDLKYHGRRDLAHHFADRYFNVSGDSKRRALLPFYSAYRAMVRAKVEGMKFVEREVNAGESRSAEAQTRAHWLLALGELTGGLSE
ncbi:MAG: hypothetical protein EXS16_14125 [Gemmataceae bacterium]|nr:hypothetical protein [Gemmataceae bacterium]